MKKFVLVIGIMMMFSFTVYGKTYYLVRHAEKADDGSKDPKLTSQGEIRARNIATMLASAEIHKIYSTDYQRTQLTATPLAEYLGSEVISYDPGQLEAFAEQLKHEAGNALIVGHSNTTPMLVHLLSGKPVINLDELDYDNVFQVTINGEEAALTLLKSLPSQVTEKRLQVQPTVEK